MRARRGKALVGVLLTGLVAGCVSTAGHAGHGVQMDHSGHHGGHTDPAAGGGGAPVADMAAPSAAGRDINPHPGSTLREGGDLRVPVDALPSNFNPLHADGTDPSTQLIAEALLPSAFVDGPDGLPVRNEDFFDRIEVESTSPHVVRYTIAQRATWTASSRSMTWEDLRAQWLALNGSDPGYEAGAHVGYQEVARVERGATDKEAVVTFREPFADWPALFGPLVPLEITQSSDAFNGAWTDAPTESSGPFEIDLIDVTAKTFVVRRNDDFWGIRPALDRISFRVVPPAARADELAGGRIDVVPIGTDTDLLNRAKGIPGVEIRQAHERRAGQLTFNGAKGKLLADQGLRTAVAQAIDPQAITDAVVSPIVPGATAVGNHVLSPGHAAYKDNASTRPYDPGAARTALDKLGWTLDGTVRAKDGKRLSMRLVVEATPVGRAVGRLVAEQLLAVGVEAKVTEAPTEILHGTYLVPGAFDLIAFERTRSPYPISHDQQAFQDVNPEANALRDRASGELDQAEWNAVVNQLDVLAWQRGHHLPLYPASGAYAVRATLANFGAPGLGSHGFRTAGFLK